VIVTITVAPPRVGPEDGTILLIEIAGRTSSIARSTEKSNPLLLTLKE
jgi:hypothetical protein